MDPEYGSDADRASARLLSGRETLSRPEHEAIAAAVLEATVAETAEQSEERTPLRWWWPAGLVALAAVGLALWFTPPDPTVAEPEPETEAFVARGNALGPQLSLTCDPCRPGNHVTLEVADAAAHRYVAVFSFRADGTAIWYAPATAMAHSAPVPHGGGGLLPFRIELDDAHPPGRYEVVALFSDSPLDRDAVRRAFESRPDDVVVVERTLRVEAAR